MPPTPTAGPIMVMADCPVHGVVEFNKRYPHDWAWWCVGHGRGEGGEDATGRLLMNGECYNLIWVLEAVSNPDGGEVRTWSEVMNAITNDLKTRKELSFERTRS